jgi:hypothetical protein
MSDSERFLVVGRRETTVKKWFFFRLEEAPEIIDRLDSRLVCYLSSSSKGPFDRGGQKAYRSDPIQLPRPSSWS